METEGDDTRELLPIIPQESQTCRARTSFLVVAGLAAIAALALLARSSSVETVRTSHKTTQLDEKSSSMSKLEAYIASQDETDNDNDQDEPEEKVSVEMLLDKKDLSEEEQKIVADWHEKHCMEQCPSRRLDMTQKLTHELEADEMKGTAKKQLTPKEKQAAKQQAKQQDECMKKCPSIGFNAQMTIMACREKCIVDFPMPGEDVPSDKSPLASCQEKCPTDGKLPRLQYKACSEECQEKTQEAEDAFNAKYSGPIADTMLEQAVEDTETKVIAVLSKKIHITHRPAGPVARVFSKFQEAMQSALDSVLGSNKGALKLYVRSSRDQLDDDVQLIVTDPGNHVDISADLANAPSAVINKLLAAGTLAEIDKAFASELAKNDFLSESSIKQKVFPVELSETTSVSIEGSYSSAGWNSACRSSKLDHSLDDHGRAVVHNGISMRQCSMTCNDMGHECFGFEYRAEEERCELWTDPICYTEETDVKTTFVDFRCFKKCI